MKKAVKKIFDKNEYYDDILGTVVTENKFRIWSFRIILLLVPVILLFLLFENVI